MARPTKYCDEILEKTREYLDEWRTTGDMIPSIESLALHLKINRATVYDWKSHEDKVLFSDMLDEILILQQKELLNNGLSGEFNASITKLVLTKHGYSDKVDSTVVELSQDEWLKTLD